MNATSFANTSALAHSPTNDTRLNDLMKEVRKFGRDAGEGGDALPKLAVSVLRAANDGVISSAKDKDGKASDVARIVESYVEEAGAKAIHERTKNGLKALQSKLRQIVQMGEMTTCDPVAVLNRAVEIRQGMLDNDGMRPKSAFAAYVDVARAQQTLDRDMSDDEISVAVTKKETADKDVLAEWKAIEKKIDRMITGEAGVTDTSDDAIAIHGAVKKYLTTMLMTRERADTIAKASELGLRVVTSESNKFDDGGPYNGVEPSETPDQLTAAERAENKRILAQDFGTSSDEDEQVAA